MSLTAPQQTAAQNLQAAIDAAVAVSDGGDGNYHRTLAAADAGTCAAIQGLEPNWTGFATESDHLIDWSNAHPPH